MAISPAKTTAVLNGEHIIVQFRCDVQTTDIPSILWSYTNTTSQRDVQISNAAGSVDSGYFVTFPNQRSSILMINNVTLHYHGVYACLAMTGLSSSQASSTLYVFSKKCRVNIKLSYYHKFLTLQFLQARQLSRET